MQTTFARTIPAIPQLFGVSQWLAKFFIPESQPTNADESRVDNIRALQRMARDLDISQDRKSTRLNSSHVSESRMPSSA